MNKRQLPSTQSRQPPFNFNLILNGIFAGITHMHSLGLAHNDITPSNIMLDENGCAVIIDFNNSGPLGVPCRSGTPGWTNFSRVSAVENDLYGYDCVQQYMHTKVMQAAQRHQTAQAANASANPGLGSPVPDLQTQPAVPATASMFAQAPPVVPSGYQWSALNAMVPVVPGVN
jgi:serine/threonine protein kinase